MSEVFGRVNPTAESVMSMQDVWMDDYQRIGISDSDSWHMVYGEDGQKTVELLANIEGSKKEYYTLSNEQGLAAAASLGDWLYGDSGPFVSKVEFMAARLEHKKRAILHQPTSEYDGIFAFGVTQASGHYDRIAHTMLSRLRERSAERGKIGLRASVDSEDQDLLSVIEKNGGTLISSKVGVIAVGGVTRDYLLYELDT